MIKQLKAALRCATALLLLPCAMHAQRATPVTHLDLNQITGTWYQIARLPDKAEKKCVSDGMILYALNDKPHSFQRGRFCKIKGGDAQYSNSSGKQNKAGTGELKVSRFFILSTKYEVLSQDPGGSWLLIGSRNHKALWLLSRTPSLDAAARAELERDAAAHGYKTEKLITVKHTVTTYRAEAGPVTGAAQGQPVVQGAPASGSPAP